MSFWDDHIGGAIPLIRRNRTVHVVDGATYKVDVTWLRYGFGVALHSPRTPRAVRRARAAEDARIHAATDRHLAHLNNDTFMAYPSGRPGWLSEFQDWPCARCGNEVDGSDDHLCKPRPGWGDPDGQFAKYTRKGDTR